MAQASGFSCDFCHKFELGEKNGQGILPPEGWLQIQVNTPQDRANKLDICGEECLVGWGKARYEALNDRPLRAPFVRKALTPEQAERRRIRAAVAREQRKLRNA